jgi:hypothetical protein
VKAMPINAIRPGTTQSVTRKARASAVRERRIVVRRNRITVIPGYAINAAALPGIDDDAGQPVRMTLN